MKVNKLILSIFVLLQSIGLQSCGQSNNTQEKKLLAIKETKKIDMQTETNVNDTAASIVLGGGCFWCVEAQYLMLDGVQKVESGYAGGNTENPTYKEVCTGLTNHAEVVKITYDPRKLSFDDILYAFWQSHDPTTLNRQGNDEGTQYRSVVFYSTEEEKQKTEAYIKKLNEEKAFDNPVVTQAAPLTKFYIAEDYHQNYYNNNKTQGYCMFVVG
ncbi:MAG: peptide-methionine (S)-S-oxide reductase MsrA, partial [Chitinophagaceae bacterium]|nr:peptide-methionine (S)-S-oxide reductase MsrA [Chitinophagaceae bacterium]